MHFLLLQGPDAARYLNGQLTNAVPPLAPGATLLACVTNHKGKLDAAPVHVHHLQDPDALLIESPVPLFDRLDRYLISDDCALDEASDRYALAHLVDTDLPRPAAALHDATNPRYGIRGRDLIFPAGEIPTDLPLPDPAHLESLRIWNQIPAWGSELSDAILPPECPVYRERAISYTKGCYIGQEVISRIKSAGKVRQELRLLIAQGDPDEPLVPGMVLAPEDDPGSEAGHLTSVAPHPRDPTVTIALGFVRRTFSQTGRLLKVRSAKMVLSVPLLIGETPGESPHPQSTLDPPT
ncbi:hypothetical protein BH23VER1_BH23VER1_37060 [soil metagenome]